MKTQSIQLLEKEILNCKIPSYYEIKCMHCKSIHVYLFIRKMPLTKPVRDLMLFLPSDNIFKFSEIIDSYLLFKKKGLFTELKILNRVRRASFKSIYNNLWL